MPDASIESPFDRSVDPSIDLGEVEKFSALAAEWWDPRGKFAPLHKFNPVRLGFIRAAALAHFGRDTSSLRPFVGLKVLDIGCGGGLLAEAMARLGFGVLGADASDRNIAIARAHAAETGSSACYRAASAERLAAEGLSFDIVLNMEVVEHVADLKGFLGACAGLVAPGGFMVIATINRTFKSLIFAKIGAEYVLGWLPRGTHDWNRFVATEALCAMLEEAGLKILKIQGVSFNPIGWSWRLSNDVDVNYMMMAGR